MQLTLTNPSSTYYTNKISIIKAIRELTGIGLKEAKDACEASAPQVLTLRHEFLDPFDLSVLSAHGYETVNSICNSIRGAGGLIDETSNVLLQQLRDLGAAALKQGEDNLANEILQLVLAEKLRRKNFNA